MHRRMRVVDYTYKLNLPYYIRDDAASFQHRRIHTALNSISFRVHH